MRKFVLLLLSLLALGPAGCLSAGDGLPPLYRHVETAEREDLEVLYPLVRRTKTPDRRDLFVFPLFWDRDVLENEEVAAHNWALLPLLFGGRDAEQGDYFALFPLWGNLKGLLAKDEIRFRLFPLYMDTREDDSVTTNLLWPLVSFGAGETRRHLRIAPFYAESESDGRNWSRSVLWPFLTWGEEHLDTEHPADRFFFFPFYGHVRSEVSWTRTFLFPFFSFSGTEAGWREENILWPVYRRMEGGDDRHALRIWPFYGTSVDGEDREDFYLWPLVWDTSYAVPEGTLDTFQVVPLIRSNRRSGLDGETLGTELQVWPLAKDRRNEEGRQFVLPAPIPFVDWRSFEANYGWLWTLFESEGSPEAVSWRVLSGLLGYESTPDGEALTLLWLLRIPW